MATATQTTTAPAAAENFAALFEESLSRQEMRQGELTVMINGIRAFLPGSLVDIRPVKDTSPYENKHLEFKVIKLDRKRNNVVVSRRAVLEESLGEEREKLLSTLSEGAIVKGIVKNI